MNDPNPIDPQEAAALNYQSGFGNEYASEAVAGALPCGRNSPQRVRHGLYAEQISGTAFTAPRHENRRSWLYRRQPSVGVRAHTSRMRRRGGRAAARSGATLAPEPMRWNPFPLGLGSGLDLIDGMRTLAANGDVERQTGVAAHVYLADRSMQRRAFVNADAEMLLVPQQGPHQHGERRWACST